MTALALVDDTGWDDDAYLEDEQSTGRGFSRGPGNAGAEWCECGFTISWPDGIPEDDRTTGLRIFDEHVAECPAAQPEPVQPSLDVPSPAAVAELHARHRADIDAVAADTIRRALQMVDRLRAVGMTPVPTARITAQYLETSVIFHPQLRTWTQ